MDVTRPSSPLPRVELALVAAAVVVTGLLSPRLPRNASLGDLLMVAAVVIFVQSLGRDLVRLRRARAGGSSASQVTCVCVESTVGLSAVVAGIALSLFWAPVRVPMAPAVWPLALAILALSGTLSRELVLDWRALRIRREPDHLARLAWRRGG